ncbi:MAG: NosD domain-containing protein [Gemmatimonadota bacterium]
MVAALLLTAVPTGAASQDTLSVRPESDLQRFLDAVAPGSVVRLEAGDHRGPVVLRRAVTVVGAPGARILGSGRGTVVTVEAPATRLDRFTVRGSGRDLERDDAGVLVAADSVTIQGLRLSDNLHGIYVRGGRGARILGNEIVGLGSGAGVSAPVGQQTGHAAHPAGHATPTPTPTTQSLAGNGIHLWSADGAVVERNHIRGGRDGIYVAHTNGARFVDNRVRETRYGIHYMYSHGNRLAGNDLARNVAGAALMFSSDLDVVGNRFHDHAGALAYGLLLQDVERSRIVDNTLRDNRVGLRLQSSSANELFRNVITGNVRGVTLGSSSRDNRYSRNRIVANLRDLELTGPVPPSDWSVHGVGNVWGGALPMDLTGDGVSEWAHHEVDLFGARREEFPALQLLSGSLGIRLLEWALGQVPVPGTRHVRDPHPLVPGGGR